MSTRELLPGRYRDAPETDGRATRDGAAAPEPGRPRRRVERGPLEDGDLRRRRGDARRDGARLGRRAEHARRLRHRLGRDRARREDADGRELQVAGDRERPRPEPRRQRALRRSPVRRGGLVGRAGALPAEGGDERPLAGRQRRRARLEGPQVGARPVRRRREGRRRRHEDPADPRHGRGRAGGQPELPDRGVRPRELQLRAGQGLRPRLQAGRVHLAAADARHPPARVRRPRRGDDPRDPRVPRRPRRDRRLRADQPALPGGRVREQRDPADRDGGRRRLLALLPAARARGAAARPRPAQRAPDGGVDVGSGGADLGRHRPDRDGRDALRRQPDLHVDGDGDDDRGRDRDHGVGHGAAGDPAQARRPDRARPGPVPRPPPRRRARVDVDPDAGAAPAAALGAAVGRPAGPPRAAGARAPHEAPELHRPAAQPRDREDVRPHQRGVPGLARAGDRRRQGAERRGAGGAEGDRATSSARRSRRSR